MKTAAIVSFRLGGSDGVSVEAAKWSVALGILGFDVSTVAGEGPVDHLLPGLAIGAGDVPTSAEVDDALGTADLVVVENICSLPLNPAAAAVVAGCCRGRPAILHHHDLPWQRAHLAHHPAPPDDPDWRHVTVNALSRRQLAGHGITAVTIYNTFDTEVPPGRRQEARRALGATEGDRLLLQPTRAIARKNVAGGLALAEALGGTYWLLGPAEDGYGPELARLLAGARCPVHHGSVPPADDRARDAPWTVADAYAAADVVVLPSTWEGFGNPAIESAVHRRPLAIGSYPVACELAAFGFEWFPVSDPEPLAAWLDDGDNALIDRNLAIARRDFSIEDLPARLEAVLHGLGLA